MNPHNICTTHTYSRWPWVMKGADSEEKVTALYSGTAGWNAHSHKPIYFPIQDYTLSATRCDTPDRHTHNFYAHLNLSFPPQREQVRSLLTNATQSHFQRYSQPQEALCQRAVHLSDRRRSHRGWKKMEEKDTGRFTQSYGYVGREQGQWRKK